MAGRLEHCDLTSSADGRSGPPYVRDRAANGQRAVEADAWVRAPMGAQAALFPCLHGSVSPRPCDARLIFKHHRLGAEVGCTPQSLSLSTSLPSTLINKPETSPSSSNFGRAPFSYHQLSRCSSLSIIFFKLLTGNKKATV